MIRSLKPRLLMASAILGFTSMGTGAATLNYSTDFNGGVGSEWTISTSYNNGDAGMLGRLQDGSATLAIASPGAGSGRLNFDLLGFNTVDALNCCTDTFRLLVNGTEILKGYFNMGGGGTEQIDVQPANTVITAPNGSVRSIAIDVAIVAGANTIRFDYGAMQGFGDESWGLDNVALAATVAAVPEPETYALMLAGLGLAGLAARRHRRA